MHLWASCLCNCWFDTKFLTQYQLRYQSGYHISKNLVATLLQLTRFRFLLAPFLYLGTKAGLIHGDLDINGEIESTNYHFHHENDTRNRELSSQKTDVDNSKLFSIIRLHS